MSMKIVMYINVEWYTFWMFCLESTVGVWWCQADITWLNMWGGEETNSLLLWGGGEVVI